MKCEWSHLVGTVTGSWHKTSSLWSSWQTSTSPHGIPAAFYREKDLDEVLQTTTIFNNVSKGILAKREDLVDVFGTDDEEKICIRILAEGDMQVQQQQTHP